MNKRGVAAIFVIIAVVTVAMAGVAFTKAAKKGNLEAPDWTKEHTTDK